MRRETRKSTSKRRMRQPPILDLTVLEGITKLCLVHAPPQNREPLSLYDFIPFGKAETRYGRKSLPSDTHVDVYPERRMA